MSEQTLQQLESLLGRMGSAETIEVDPAHCYALRRALLNSPRFERNRFRLVWTRLFVYTSTLVAGGAVAAVLVVNVLTVELTPSIAPSTVVSAQGPAQLAESKRPQSIEFVSFTDRPAVRQVLEFARPDVQLAEAR